MAQWLDTYHLGADFPERLKEFVDRFLADGRRYFDREFSQLDAYLRQVHSSHTSERLRHTEFPEYLLELVAFAIYDRRDREAFNRTRNTLIVMPDCLSLHNPDCEKTDGKHGDICRSCTESCGAYEMVALGRRFGVRSIFSKRKLGEQLRYFDNKLGDLSVIGIACIKMLAAGMRTAREEKIPARGVLLGFSGCEHWHDQPCASQYSVAWLRSILTEKYGTSDSKT
jgi:hypothetical protein